MNTSTATNDRFYTDLPAFDDFDRVADPTAFSSVPGDWIVVVADIRGSTQAIADGRYKDVNMVGAACITAATNAVDPSIGAIAYVFGGDGATLLVPESLIASVREALIGAAVLARRDFGFELRIGAVPVSDLRADGLDVTVGKLRLSPGNELAMLGGGGIAEADRRIKAEPEPQVATDARYRIPISEEAGEPDMTGLSCRWEPLKAQRGVMLCLMVLALPDAAQDRRAVYDRLLRDVETILDGDLQSASPVTPQTLRYKWIPKGLRMEARLTRGRRPTWVRFASLVLETLIQFVLEKTNQSFGGYDAPAYREELRGNSDYRRFDDVLRLILDCTQAQADRIIELLKEKRSAGEIAYGLHQADHALMTCLVFNLSEGEHVHFVDGGLGGFTAASRGFKQQLKEQG